MVTRRQIKAMKKLSNFKKQKSKFPDLLLKIVDISDIILQITDARFIKETRNFEIEEYIKKKGKKIIYVLNKSDLVDVPSAKKNLLLGEVFPYVFVSCKDRRGGKLLRSKIKLEAKKLPRDHFKRIQVGVIGYPNAGKSSVINLLVGRSSAKTGAEAGFTKGIQKLKLTSNILLLDSPGVIPNSEYSKSDVLTKSKNVKVGARDFSRVKDPEIAVSGLIQQYKEAFSKFYKIKIEDPEDFFVKLGKKKDMLIKGGGINEDKICRMILRDWQEGKIRV